jgi:hypothetical protein
LKESSYVIEQDDQEEEEATGLVIREAKRKEAADAEALQKALEIADKIKVPVEDLLKDSTVEAAKKIVELSRNLQELVVADELLSPTEEAQKKEAGCSEAAASEATRGSTNSHTALNPVIEIESSETSTSASHSTSVSTCSADPFNRVYANVQKILPPHHLPNSRKRLLVRNLCLCIHKYCKV